VTAAPPRRPGVTAVRSRATFADLRRSSSRGRSGPLSVSFVARPAWDRSQVAYAVNRKVGNAVQRNRLRRRLRAVVADRAADLPVGAYVVRSTDGGPDLDFDELKVAMSQALDKATSRSSERTGR
jgi:ribonuclease P protein component